MTVKEIIDRVWLDCGEPNDIDPETTTGAEFFVQALNTSVGCVVNWKGYMGARRVHFPEYVKNTFVRNKRETVTLTNWETEDIEISTAPTFTIEAGDVIEYNGESRVIYLVEDTTNFWIPSVFDNYDVTVTTATITQNLLDPGITRLIDYLRVENVTQSEELRMRNKRDSNIDDLSSPGLPEKWQRHQGKIEFDVPPDAVYVWRVWYYGLPELATTASYTADEAIDLPEEFHPACKAYLESIVNSHRQEPEMATAAYRVFDSLMKTTQGSWERRNQLQETPSVGIRI